MGAWIIAIVVLAFNLLFLFALLKASSTNMECDELEKQEQMEALREWQRRTEEKARIRKERRERRRRRRCRSVKS